MGKKALIGAIAGIAVGTASILLADALGAIDLGDIVCSIASAGRKAMAIQVPMWGVFLVSFLLFAIVSMHLSVSVFNEKKRREKVKANWRNRTSMEYGGHLFRWEYLPDWMPSNIREVCHMCGDDLGVFGCNCGSKRRPLLGADTFILDLQKVIIANVKHGEYRK